MNKKIFTVLLSFLLIISSVSITSYASTLVLSSHANNSLTVGESQVFTYDKNAIMPDSVYVNDVQLDSSKYVINNEMGKIYIYGSVFSTAGSTKISAKSSSDEAVVTINFKDRVVTNREYTVAGTTGYTYGSSVDPASRAGKEHTATGNAGTRQPIIVRSITSAMNDTTWVKWNITNAGNFTIKYWCPKTIVANSVNIIVKDSSGEHTFNNIKSRYEQVAEYAPLLNSDGFNYVFKFKGDGSEYVLVKNGEIRTNFIIDSFMMTSIVAEHDLTNLNVSSSKYTVGDGKISNILFNSSKEDFINNVNIPFDCAYELSSTGDIVNEGDTLTVYKMFDPSISTQYTIDNVKYMDINDCYNVQDGVISEIPYGESITSFLNNITRNSQINLKILDNGVETAKDVVEDGNVLAAYFNDEIVEQYQLSVLPLSSEKTLTSSVYVIDDESITVPYGEEFDTFLSNITIPKFAQLTCTYRENANVVLKKNFQIVVTAQDLSEKIYNVVINVAGFDESHLTSTAYTVNGFTVSGVTKGVSVTEFLSKISATNAGIIKIYDVNMKNKIIGTMTGGETVRVYPRYRYKGNDYFSYAVKYIPEKRVNNVNTVWACANNELNTDPNLVFSYSGLFKDGNTFATKRIGYQNTFSHAIEGTANFSFTAQQAGNYKIEYYCIPATNGQNYDYTYSITKNGQTIGANSILIGQPALLDMGTYALEQGDKLVFSSTRLQNNFVSAVLFSEITEYLAEVTDTTVLPDGKYNIKVDFDFDVEESSLTNNIKIISENGNQMPFSMQNEANSYYITTDYPLEDSVKYFLVINDQVKNINGLNISGSSISPIVTKEDGFNCTVRMDYSDASGEYTPNFEIAKNVNLDMTLTSVSALTAKVNVIWFNNINAVSIDSQSYSVNEGDVKSITQTLIKPAGANRMLIFVTDESGALLTNTFYAE